MNKEKELFGYTKTQLENTSLRKTTGKFHYRRDYNDPVLEGERGGSGNQGGSQIGTGSYNGVGDGTGNLQEDGDALSSAIQRTG